MLFYLKVLLVAVIAIDQRFRGTDQRYQLQGTRVVLPIAKGIVEAYGDMIGVVSQ